MVAVSATLLPGTKSLPKLRRLQTPLHSGNETEGRATPLLLRLVMQGRPTPRRGRRIRPFLLRLRIVVLNFEVTESKFTGGEPCVSARTGCRFGIFRKNAAAGERSLALDRVGRG
eukprot:Hpha_TRINITY_DN26692_c0_g1::TRINITY_DN26692_c0_g1_i1::g.85917::m.85917